MNIERLGDIFKCPVSDFLNCYNSQWNILP